MQEISLTETQSFLLSLVSSVEMFIATVLTSTVILSLGIILVDFGYKTLIQGRTSWLSSHVKVKGNYIFDHAPFVKPYKTYNRFRSYKWNIKNTLQ